MTDFLWPTTVIPARSEVMLRDLSARFSSPFTGTTRTYSRPGGDLLMMSLTLPPLQTAKRGAMQAMLAQLRGGVHRVWCKDHSYVKRGSFPATELVPNNTFANGTTGWTASYATQTVQDGVLRLTASAHTAGQYPNTMAINAVSLTSGQTYCARSAYQSVYTSGTYYGHLLNNSATALSSSYATTDGLRITTLTADSTVGSNFDVKLADDAATGDSFEVPYTSVSRCALVKGASQSTSRILIDQLPASTDGLLLPGDQVQIGEELLIVRAALNSNSAGEGYLYLHRPLRSAPADNAPVIIHEPMGLFMLADSENGWMNEPGRFSSATVNLIEAVR